MRGQGRTTIHNSSSGVVSLHYCFIIGDASNYRVEGWAVVLLDFLVVTHIVTSVYLVYEDIFLATSTNRRSNFLLGTTHNLVQNSVLPPLSTAKISRHSRISTTAPHTTLIENIRPFGELEKFRIFLCLIVSRRLLY